MRRLTADDRTTGQWCRRLECVIQQQGGDIQYMIWRPQNIM